MLANAQRDGRPAEYRWRCLFKAAVWLMPTTRVQCSKSCQHLKFAEVPQTRQQVSAISGPSSLYCEDMWGRHCCLTSFIFPIVDTCLGCEAITQQVGWLEFTIAFQHKYSYIRDEYSPTKLCDGAQMTNVWVLHFQRAACNTFQTCILNSH